MGEFKPSAYQQNIFDWVNKEQSGSAVINAVAGSGKCLGRGTPILMFDGSIKAVENIEAHDCVMGPDSLPRHVWGVTSGTDDLYRITPVKGDSWICNSKHVLTLVDSVTDKVFDVSLSDLNLRSKHHDAKLFRVPVDFPSFSVPLDPYLCGLWLGDGTKGSPTITNAKPQIHKYCQNIAEKYGCELILRQNDHDKLHNTFNLRFRVGIRGKANSKTPNRIWRVLKTFVDRDGQKRIREDYLRNSESIRLSVLAGLLDTDGHYENGYFEIITKYPGLKDDIVYLARSLGFAAYASVKHATIKSIGFSGDYWRITISGEISRIPCIVYQIAPRRQKKNVLRTGFSVEPIGSGEYFGFELDGDGRFLLGDFTVTHNTTTLEQAARLLPSDQSAVFVAFNQHIVQELKNRLIGTPMIAVTVHSAGRSALAKARRLGDPDTKKYNKIVKALFERRHLRMDYGDISGITRLIDQTRNSLTDPSNLDALFALAFRFDVALSNWKLLSLVKESLEIGEDQVRNAGMIDFTDMIYIPIVWKLDPAQSDIVFGDEIQDWSPMQLELVSRMVKKNGRFLGTGDPRQSIFAFAGADDQSFWKIKDRLKATELPLSVCYRCPKSHVALAKEYVPEIEAFEGNKEGTILYESDSNLFKLVREGDLILCRKTAPLVKHCIALIGAGVSARVRGRNIGKKLTDLAKTVSKMTEFTVDRFPRFLDEYKQVQIQFLAQKEDGDEMIESLSDQCAALDASFRRYYEKGASFEAVLMKIEDLFSDDRPAVWLSTIHRAKGLEANRVMILDFDSLPMTWKNQQPYQYKQEENLVYVALTRSKDELILFGNWKDEKEAPKNDSSLIISAAESKILTSGSMKSLTASANAHIAASFITC